MECWKDYTEVIANSLTSFALIAGGIWTYFMFVRQRIAFPKLNIELFIQTSPLPKETKLVHVHVKIFNIGKVLVSPKYAELRLRKIVPIPSTIIEELNDDIDPIPAGKTEFEWPLYNKREWHWKKKDIEFEPGENDSLHADFIIPDNFDVIELYCFIKNPRKKRDDLGWSHTEIYTLNSKED